MIQISPGVANPDIVYPESDGLPMADNSKQLRWIVTLYGNLEALYRDRPDVLVGGNLLWYPVEGEPELRNAPDAFVVFGRPKGDRGSYQQWKEENIPLTVVVEVLSPGNTYLEMADKLAFYEEHGAEEYYVYDPDNNRLLVHVRQGEVLRRIRPPHNFVSPRLGIRFDLSGVEMVVYRPDGVRFRTFEELQADWERERKLRLEAEQRVSAAENRASAAETRASTAETRASTAETRASTAETRVTDAEKRASAAEQHRRRQTELSRKARRGQATPEELAELERLEEQTP